MSKADFKSFYVSGIRAFRSAAEQGVEGAKKAKNELTDPELKKIAGKVGDLMARHEHQLSLFLKEDGAGEDSFRDQIMDGVGRGTKLMKEAAHGQLMLDIALVSGSTVGLEYFVNSFSQYSANSALLGLDERVPIFKKMASEHQELKDEYAEAISSTIIPKVFKD